MAGSNSGGIAIERLNGIEDYNNWKFLLKMMLMHEDLHECILSEEGSKDDKKNQRALAKICLSVGTSALAHVRNATTPYQAWTNLQKAYEDKGLSRRLGLLRSLFAMKLSDSMQSYLSKITELAQQLDDIGAPLADEFIAVIMLSGLPSNYDPLIMALENCSNTLTSEIVKSKLLQEQIRRDDKCDNVELNALAVKKSFKCFRCKKAGHLKRDCPLNQNNRSQEKKNKNNWTPRENKSLLTALSVKMKNDSWYIDSGATNHMCNDKQMMFDFQCLKPLDVSVANGEKLATGGQGKVQVNMKGVLKTISNVYYIPKLSGNLLSVSELCRKGYVVKFNDKGCLILDGCNIIATGTYVNGVYQLDIDNVQASDVGSEVAMNSVCRKSEKGECSEAASASGEAISQELWHRRLGHLNLRSMKLMKNGLVTGMHFKDTSYSPCVSCIEGKQTKLPFPAKSNSRSNELLGLIHTDVCGPMQSTSINGLRYFVTFIDDYTRKTFVYFLKTKDEVFEKFKIFQVLVEKETGRKIKVIRSDNGGEYISACFQKYLQSCGIRHQTTIPHCSEQNGVAERANRTIMDKARCMLQNAGLEKQYWAEAANTAVYLKNHSPSKAVMGTTPEEKWTSKKVNVSHLRTFGCIAYAMVDNMRKLDARSKKYIFVGYCENSKGYRLIDPKYPKKCVKARHVTFLENVFLNKKLSDDEIKESAVVTLESSPVLKNYIGNDTQLNTDKSNSAVSPTSSYSIGDIPQSDDTNQRRQTMFQLDSTQESVDTDNSSDCTYIPGPTDIDSEESSTMTFEDSVDAEFAGLAEMSDEDLPMTMEEAMCSSEAPQWKEAVQDEYNSFITNECWTLVDLPKGQKPIKCKWVFSKKKGLNGELLKYKARLVAKGYTQKYGIDYHETFSPVVRYSSIRILLALAAQNAMLVEHLDVKTAFLNGNLEEDVYMEQPEGFIKENNNIRVYKLKKAIYGLKQSAKSWYEKINDVLTNKLKFKRLSSEPCVYIYNHDNETMIISLYVDDILLFSSKSSHEKEYIKKQLMSEFQMKDLGQAHHILGMRVARTDDGSYTLDQKNYIKKILCKFKMSDCKSANTPMEVGLKLQKEENTTCNLDYRSLIGYLMYLTVCSRPDIAHSVSYLSQFNNCYSEAHWKAAKRVLRYLKGTMDYCLVFSNKGDMEITAFVDADWGGDQLNRRSFTGYVFNLGNSIVSWESRKQRTVALSSTEAEYMAISDSCKEAMFLKTFVHECTGIMCKVKLFNDNQSAQKLCINSICHSRTKHIDIRHHFIRELINKNEISLSYVPTQEMLADVMTKSLPKDKHCKFVSLLFQCF